MTIGTSAQAAQKKQHTHIMPLILLLLLASFLASCTPRANPYGQLADIQKQGDESVKAAIMVVLDKEARLFRVAWPLQLAALDMCHGGNKSIGIKLIHHFELPRNIRHLAAEIVGAEGFYVVEVAPGSPAHNAGLKRGDQLITMQGLHLNGQASYEEANKRVQELPERTPITLRYLRDGIASTASILPVNVCNYEVYMVQSDEINAYADGLRVVIFAGMEEFTESDAELALVVAHEIAHNAMKHIEKKVTNRAIGLVLDTIIARLAKVDSGRLFEQIGAQVFSQEFEREADYVGLYIMALADYDINNGVADFWRRMGTEASPASINFGATHPTTPDRFLVLESTIDEINEKIAAGRKLVPELKG